MSETALTVDRLRAILTDLLKERACLLVIDDVWQRRHVEVFKVDGSRCCLFLTTRDAEVARGIGAHIHPIPTMTSTEAVALLDEWSDGALVDSDPTVKTTIVKELGYLPLAIRLAGAQLRSKARTTGSVPLMYASFEHAVRKDHMIAWN